METEIILKFNRQDFEDIYYKDKQGNLFWSQLIKKQFIAFLILTPAFFISTTYSVSTNQLVFVTAVLFFVWLIVGYLYIRKMSALLKWKEQINNYLSRLSKIEQFKLVIGDHSFTIFEDTEETIEKWSSITKASLKEDFICLIGSETYFFPKKSMSEGEYEVLWNVASDKIKNGI